MPQAAKPLALALFDAALSQQTLGTINKFLHGDVPTGLPLSNHCSNIICSLLQDYLRCISKKDPKIQDCVQRILDFMEIATYIYNNPTEDLRQNTLCEKYNRTPKQMNKLIKEMADETLKGLIISLKLLRSEKLLIEEPDLSIEHIYKACGYDTRQGYYKAFAKKNKVTPDTFRQLNGYLPQV
jgi:AraC-like DNA-binding protein